MDTDIKIALMICFALAKGKGREIIAKIKKSTSGARVESIINVLLVAGIISLGNEDEQIKLAKHPREIGLLEIILRAASLSDMAVGIPAIVPSETSSGKPSVDFVLSSFPDESITRIMSLTLQDVIDYRKH